ncbi:hypothetical protein KAT92_06275 [Candidatus Babeliales bacterium]|nr:hypothetical protein [Candidatus Babeliales bacterium]
MRRKNINTKLTDVFNDWLSSIDDQKTRNLVAHNSIITGGCISSMLRGEPVNDYDIYFKNRETTIAIAEYYINKYCGNFNNDAHIVPQDKMSDVPGCKNSDRVYIMIPDAGIVHYEPTETEIADKTKYLPKVLTCNAITLTDNIQLITRFFGSIDTIHSTFDFEHCKCHWDSSYRNVILPPSSLECILTKQLIYTGSLYPICSIIRTRKFIKREWNISAGEYLKMAYQISKLDLDNVDVLADQLIGVDVAYFNDLIDQLKTYVSGGGCIDNLYIVKLVDEIFN